ncbi:hypothetical protein [Streptomyces sp. NPDC001068]|uniref:hypothetical protein n=1 Tax=Streptomyces sp. NPDC001068 TaxID=3364544 RepID=UPI003699F0AC
MTTGNQLPAERPSNDDPAVLAAIHVAMQWQGVDAAHLSAALAAMEPSLKREHRERLTRMEMQREVAQQALDERHRERAHQAQMTQLICGTVLALAMLGGGFYVARESWWLSTLLCGPSLLALIKVFILGRSDPDDMKHVSLVSRASANAAGQGQQPPAP